MTDDSNMMMKAPQRAGCRSRLDDASVPAGADRNEAAARPARANAGFTMMETLVAVAIIAIMGGLVIMSLFNTQKNLYQLEMDGFAKEIYVTAQNHLSTAKSEGTLDVVSKGAPEAVGSDIYYYIYTGSNSAQTYYANPETNALGQMLPFGSIDDTARISGSYVVRYQVNDEVARVLDVFYADPSGTDFGGRYATSFEADDYDGLVDGYAGEGKSLARQSFKGDGIIGWWGGDDVNALNLMQGKLNSPVIKVENAERLRVTVNDTNVEQASGWADLRLEVRGVTSGATMAIPLKSADLTKPVDHNFRDWGTNPSEQGYVVDLDDVTSTGSYFRTSVSSGHFVDIAKYYADATTGEAFIPGEDLEIQAIASTTQRLAVDAKSATEISNSLFDSISAEDPSEDAAGDDGQDARDEATSKSAIISSVRHLENLSQAISGYSAQALTSAEREKASQQALATAGQGGLTGQALTAAQLAAAAGADADDVLPIVGAIQVNDLSWNNFRYALGEDKFDEVEGTLASDEEDEEPAELKAAQIAEWCADEENGAQAVTVQTQGAGQSTAPGTFMPITYATATGAAGGTSVPLNYDGSTFRIADVVVSGQEQAGLFASLAGGSVKDVELVNFDISTSIASEADDSAGAGAGDNAAASSDTARAGALAASATNTEITNVFAHNEPAEDATDAALEITGAAAAGGLVGLMTGGSIDQSAAALYVRATNGATGSAGGLVGDVLGNAKISNSYTGGHTFEGKYRDSDDPDFLGQDVAGRMNVIGGVGVGGLVGNATLAGDGFSVTNCYSTASVYGAFAGGLIGAALQGTVENSYATGLVKASGAADITTGAFAGLAPDSTVTFKDNYYFQGASPNMKGCGLTLEDPEGVTGTTFAAELAREGGLAHEGDPRADAQPYDLVVSEATGDKFDFASIGQLNSQSADDAPFFLAAHYGDWVVPESTAVYLDIQDVNEENHYIIVTDDNYQAQSTDYEAEGLAKLTYRTIDTDGNPLVIERELHPEMEYNKADLAKWETNQFCKAMTETYVDDNGQEKTRKRYYVLIDSITTNSANGSSGHAADRFPGIQPGADITITATRTTYDDDVEDAFVQKSLTTNSLFASIERVGNVNAGGVDVPSYSAVVKNGRQIQNLEPNLSGLTNETTGLKIVGLKVANDIMWEDIYSSKGELQTFSDSAGKQLRSFWNGVDGCITDYIDQGATVFDRPYRETTFFGTFSNWYTTSGQKALRRNDKNNGSTQQAAYPITLLNRKMTDTNVREFTVDGGGYRLINYTMGGQAASGNMIGFFQSPGRNDSVSTADELLRLSIAHFFMVNPKSEFNSKNDVASASFVGDSGCTLVMRDCGAYMSSADQYEMGSTNLEDEDILKKWDVNQFDSSMGMNNPNGRRMFSKTGTAAGIVGRVFGSLDLKDCFASIPVFGGPLGNGNSCAAGGLVGAIAGWGSSVSGRYVRIEDCYAGGYLEQSASKSESGTDMYTYSPKSIGVAAFSESGNTGVGGIIGWQNRGQNVTIKNCYSTAAVAGNMHVGGFIGRCDINSTSSVVDCYSLGTVYEPSDERKNNSGVFAYANTSNVSALTAFFKNCFAFGAANTEFTEETGDYVHPTRSLSRGLGSSGDDNDIVPFHEDEITLDYLAQDRIDHNGSTSSTFTRAYHAPRIDYPYRAVTAAGRGLEAATGKTGDSGRFAHFGDWPAIVVILDTSLEIWNRDTLTARISMPADQLSDSNSIAVLVRGESSGQEAYIQFKVEKIGVDYWAIVDQDASSGIGGYLAKKDVKRKVPTDGGIRTLSITLDDVTGGKDDEGETIGKGMHFAELFPDFWPGEGLQVAVDQGTKQQANLRAVLDAGASGWTKKGTAVEERVLAARTNSLFADSSTDSRAQIAYVRHLQNLDPVVSNVVDDITTAKVERDLEWSKPTYPYIYRCNSSTRVTDSFYGIYNDDLIAFDGDGHTLSDFVINAAPSIMNGTGAYGAGLFRLIDNGAIVENAKLVDFVVNAPAAATGVAGTLAAVVQGQGATVRNIVAYHSAGYDKIVTGGRAAGGLVGEMERGSIESSAAAVRVSANNGDAGGLVGAAGMLNVSDSYAGGHTQNGGDYNPSVLNVVAGGTGSAGGLVGSATQLNAQRCYSTCSAKGPANVGGFVGTILGGTVADCYATGLVSGGANTGAFAGYAADGVSFGKAYYFDIINDLQAPAVASGPSNGVSAIDASTKAYNDYLKACSRATTNRYDTDLPGRFALNSVKDLGANLADGAFVATHYGDWPTPETLAVNVPSNTTAGAPAASPARVAGWGATARRAALGTQAKDDPADGADGADRGNGEQAPSAEEGFAAGGEQGYSGMATDVDSSDNADGADGDDNVAADEEAIDATGISLPSFLAPQSAGSDDEDARSQETGASTLKKKITTADGTHYTVKVELDDASDLPEGAALSVKQVLQTPADYDPKKAKYRNRPTDAERFVSAKAMQSRGAALQGSLNVGDADYVFFNDFLDIALVDADGNELHPQAGMTVTLETDAVDQSASDALGVSFIDQVPQDAEYASELATENRSGDAQDDKAYKSGAKLVFRTAELSELGIGGVAVPRIVDQLGNVDVALLGASRIAAQTAEAQVADDALTEGQELALALSVRATPNYAYGARFFMRLQANGADGEAEQRTLSAYRLQNGMLGDLLATSANPDEMQALQSGDSIALVWDDVADAAKKPAKARRALGTQADDGATITWVNEDGTVLETDEGVAVGAKPTYDGETPVKDADAQYTYTFAGWTPEITEVAEGQPEYTYAATYTAALNKYTVTWKNDDGTVLKTDEDVAYGTTPAYGSEEPTKASTDQYSYTFSGWTPEVEAVTGDVTYTATYTEKVNTYTITWLDEDGSKLYSEAFEYGATPTYGQATPTKSSTAQYNYAFADWSPSVGAVTHDATYTATYTETVRTYKITWKNDNDAVLKTDEVPYGKVPAYEGDDPTKADDTGGTYSFSNWDPAPVAVVGDAEYKAQYTTAPIVVSVQDQLTKEAISGATFTLTNSAGTVVWQATTGPSGTFVIPRVNAESAVTQDGGGATLEPGSAYTLAQTATDSAHFKPKGTWTLAVAENGTFSIQRNASAADLTTQKVSGPYGIRFYLYNMASSDLTFDYNYPAGASGQPASKTVQLGDLSYDYRYSVTVDDPALDGYEFAGWSVDGSASTVKKGGVARLDTVNIAHHTLKACWRSPLKMRAITYAGDDKTDVSGSEGVFAVEPERALSFAGMQQVATSYGVQNSAVATLNGRTDIEFAYATLKQDGQSPVTIASLRYDLSTHAWQYKELDYATTWTNVAHGSQLDLYYVSNSVNVQWMVEGDGGALTKLRSEGKSLAVGTSTWTSSDTLVPAADKPTVEDRYFYRYIAFGPAGLSSTSGLEKTDQSFWLRNSNGGFRYRTSGTGDGDLLKGNTIYVVYSETPPADSALLNIENHTNYVYALNRVLQGTPSDGNDLVSAGKVVLMGGNELRVLERGSEVLAQQTAQLVLLGASTSQFTLDGGYASMNSDETVSMGIVGSSSVARRTLEQGQVRNTYDVARGWLEGSTAVAVTFDTDLVDWTIQKEWNDVPHTDNYRASFDLFEVEGASDGEGAEGAGGGTAVQRRCVMADVSNGLHVVDKNSGWAATVENLPKRLTYTVAEHAITENGQNKTDDFTPSYSYDPAAHTATVTNTASKVVCRVGSEEFLTIRAAVDYITSNSMHDATIEMLEDYVMAASGSVTIPSGYNITLKTADDRETKTVTRGFTGDADTFLVESGATLTVTNVTVSGKLSGSTFAKSGNGGLVNVASGGTFVAGQGAVLTGARADNGSAVYVGENATATFAGARVTDCRTQSGGAIGVAGATSRVKLSGDAYIYDNHEVSNNNQRNVFLDQDSNEVLQVVDGGLGENAQVGVYVPNGEASTLYNAHGKPAKPFATFADGADVHLDKLVSDRISAGPSKYGASSTVIEKTVVWGETFSFTAEVQWLDEHLNQADVPDGAKVELTLEDGSATLPDGVQTPIVLEAGGTWTCTFQGLARYDENGDAYEYKLNEAIVAPGDYRRIIFADDKATQDNPLVFSDDAGDTQKVLVSNYYRYTTFKVNKTVKPDDQTLNSTFELYRVPKTGMQVEGDIRYDGVGGVNDLPQALRGGVSEVWANAASQDDAATVNLAKTDTFFTVYGGNRWYIQLKDEQRSGSDLRRGIDANLNQGLVKFHAFYDSALYGDAIHPGGTGFAVDGVELKVGDVVCMNGTCSVLGNDNDWHEFATGVKAPYISFNRQDGNGGVESTGGEDAGKSCTIANSDSYEFTIDDKLEADYYYYVIETSVQETNNQGRTISGSHKLVAAYNPQYSYDQRSGEVSVTNTRRDYLSVDKIWPDDATSFGACEFDVYEIADGSTVTYLSNDAQFSDLVLGKVEGTKIGSFSLPEKDTGSWVHVFDDDEKFRNDSAGKVYFARERSAGTVIILNPDVKESSAATDAVYSYDPNVNQITVRNMSDILCKIDDNEGEHPFRTLNAALEYGRERDTSKTGGSNTEFTIQMLRDYTIPASDAMQIRADEKITLTTASTTQGKFTYKSSDSSKTKATITRKSGNQLPFAIVMGDAAKPDATCMTFDDITLDGAEGAVSFKLTGSNTTYTNGGIVYARNAAVKLQAGGGDGTGVEVRNAKASHGGAIYADGGNVDVNKASFANCQTTSTQNGDQGGGGAIWASGSGTTSVKDSAFTDCTSRRNGGAIATIYQTSGAAGSERTIVTGCTFERCTAEAGGGGVYSRNTTLSVGGADPSKACTFVDCTGNYFGGGVSHYNDFEGSVTTVQGCTFTSCKTTNGGTSTNRGSRNGGGGISSDADKMVLKDCSFNACHAYTRGGGVMQLNTDAHYTIMDNCVFESCTASTVSGAGGGAACTAGLDQTITNCRVVNCQAITGAGGGFDIGYFEKDKDARIENCYFEGCQSGTANGGGICFGGRTLTVKASTFKNCKAPNNSSRGGGISFAVGGSAVKFDVLGCTFDGCSSETGAGGAINANVIELHVAASDDGTRTTFKDCMSRSSGGAIYQEKSGQDTKTYVHDADFSNCASGDKEANTGSVGGAICSNYVCVLDVADSTFTNCSSKNSGGSIYHAVNGNYRDYSSATINQSVFKNSECWGSGQQRGGALWTDALNLQVTGVPGTMTFDHCQASYEAGAIYHGFGSNSESNWTNLEKCTFASCYANGGSGGAVFSYANKIGMTGVDGETTFFDCHAVGHGGAVYHARQSATSWADLKQCSFENCEASYGTSGNTNNVGGAMHTSATKLDVNDSSFKDCSARGMGGGLYHAVGRDYWEETYATVKNTEFVNCHSTNNWVGGLYTGTQNMTLTNDTFQNCTAKSSVGGVYQGIANGDHVDSSFAKVTGCTFTSCEAHNGEAGALRSNAMTLTVAGVAGTDTFVDCNSTGAGGAIYHERGNDAAVTTIDTCRFSNCATTASSGGAVRTNADKLYITGVKDETTFLNCRARYDGGAVSHNRQTKTSLTDVKQCKFVSCEAGLGAPSNDNRSGGSIHTNATKLTLVNSQFKQSKTNGYGGAVSHGVSSSYYAESNAEVTSCTFEDCESVNRNQCGGGLYTSAHPLKIADSTFTNCASQGNGGGVFHSLCNAGNSDRWANSEDEITGTTFANCTSSGGDGGGLHTNALHISVTTDSAFEKCEAFGNGGGLRASRNSEGSSLTLEKCTFTECKAGVEATVTVRGGGVSVSPRVLTITDATFADCVARNDGGCVSHYTDVANSKLTAKDSTFANGTATLGYGGGIYSQRSEVSLTNCTVADCSADRGGGLYQAGGENKPVVLDSCTFTGNTAAIYGGAVYFYSNEKITLRNGTSITGNTLGNATVENAAGVFLHWERSGATLVLGAEGQDADTITVYDNKTSAGEQSNVRVIRNGKNRWLNGEWRQDDKNNETELYSNSIVFLSRLVKPGSNTGVDGDGNADGQAGEGDATDATVSPSVGNIGVVNPGHEGTRFGMEDIAERANPGVENIVSDIDTLYGVIDPSDNDGKRVIWFAPLVCKITDSGGNILRYGEGSGALAAFSTLSAAVEVLNHLEDGYLRNDVGMLPSPLHIEMLVPSYRLNANLPPLLRDVTLTTAKPWAGDPDDERSQYYYPASAPSEICTITRAQNATGSLFTVESGIEFTVEKMTLDGGSSLGSPLAPAVDGGLIHGNAGSKVVLGEDAVLQNSAVSGNSYGGAVYMEGGADSDVPALVMDKNATIVGCSAQNGGGVYLTPGARCNMNDTVSIKDCSAAGDGGAVYVSPNAALSFENNPNVSITGNRITDPSGHGAGIYLAAGAAGDSTLYLKNGASGGFGDNYIEGTEDESRTNGGEDYPLLRQDIYLAASGDPATSIVVTGDVALDPGSVWVWAEYANHYEQTRQFAVFADGADAAIKDKDKTMASFRDARDDADTAYPMGYLTGGEGDNPSHIYWSPTLSHLPQVILKKVDPSGNAVQGAKFVIYRSDMQRVARDVKGHPLDGTDLDEPMVSGEAGAFFIGRLYPGTYYLEETTVPDGYDYSATWFKLVVTEDGTATMEGPKAKEDL